MLTARPKKNNFFCLICEHFNVFNALKEAVKYGFVQLLLMS
jgi:hypothetical protein